ncbi:hypothetical protein L6251_02935, partial [Candidatus Parcubacteria bacterium]|nr:hypothetical protein [Candidatus Parcubacteria bacterium]
CLNKWTESKMRKVALGLAESSFPYRDYTEQELAKMYPQIKYADVPTRVTPEETYAKFRQALKENNLELAIEQLSRESEKYKENVDVITKVYNENRFNEIYETYPEDIWRGTFGESIGQLCYKQKHEDGEFIGCSSFTKDANGDWKLDSL